MNSDGWTIVTGAPVAMSARFIATPRSMLGTPIGSVGYHDVVL